jgi:hypothetical protein
LYSPLAPIDIVLADIDGANGPDMIQTKFFDSIELRFNRGDGTFGPGIAYPINRGQGPAVGDFDLDGDLDLVTASFVSPDATIMPNTADGSLGDFIALALGFRTQQVVAADLDGRGGLDLVFSDEDPAVDQLFVLLNDILSRPVGVDVQPFREPNIVDPYSPSLIAMAILSADDFDALQVNPDTLRIDPGAAGVRTYRIYDGNQDGLPDFVAYVRARGLVIGCGETRIDVTGSTHAGVEFLGNDVVVNRRCP